MTNLFKWLRQIVLALLIVFGLALVAVWTLRWFAKDESAREALALMQQATPAATGENGFRWLAFADRRIPESELDAAIATELAAFRDWQVGQGERLLDNAGSLSMGYANVGQFASPAAAAYPERPKVEAPDLACSLRDTDCLPRVSGQRSTPGRRRVLEQRPGCPIRLTPRSGAAYLRHVSSREQHERQDTREEAGRRATGGHRLLHP